MSSGTPPTKPWQKAGNDSGSNTHKPWQGGTQTASVENSPVTRPSRPWEDSEEGAARAGTSTVAPVSGALNSPTSTSYGVGGIGTGYGGYSPYNTYGSYGSYGSPYLNRYGGFGSYGGMYGGGMMGYRYGMGGMYGNYGGGSAMGAYGDPQTPTQPPQAWQRILNIIGGVLGVFGKIAFLVDENTQAVHFFMNALLQLIDRAGSLYAELVRFVLRLLGWRRKSKQEAGYGETASKSSVAPQQLQGAWPGQ